MDPLTHLAMGAAIANVGFRDRLGRSALWVGAGIAACADLDLFLPRLLSALGKPVEFGLWTLHRGPTHSLLWATTFCYGDDFPSGSAVKLMGKRLT